MTKWPGDAIDQAHAEMDARGEALGAKCLGDAVDNQPVFRADNPAAQSELLQAGYRWGKWRMRGGGIRHGWH